jgi:hypothetical protein
MCCISIVAVTKFLSEDLNYDEDTAKKFEDLGIRTMSDFSELDVSGIPFLV